MPATPPSVSICKVTIGRVPFGFSAAPASGSSVGRATIEERIPDIFIGLASACDKKEERDGSSRSPRRDVAAEAQRVADRRNALRVAAGAVDRQLAKAENPPQDRLLDADAFDLRDVHL